MNNDQGLEKEADVMGARVNQLATGSMMAGVFRKSALKSGFHNNNAPIQRVTSMYIKDHPAVKGAGLLTAVETATGTEKEQFAVTFGILSSGGCGTAMQAWLYPNDTHRVRGTAPSVRPPWWLQMHQSVPPQDSQWISNNVVQGHLLNHNLGGPGDDMRNLTPFAKDTNAKHHSEIEKVAKTADQKGLILYYRVKVDYSKHPPATAFGNKIPLQYLKNFPYQIDYEYEEYDPTTYKSATGMRLSGYVTNAMSGQ